MPQQLSVMVNAELQAGPKISLLWQKEVDAHDRLSHTIAPGATDKVAVQPSEVDKIELFILTVKNPKQYGSVTYKVDGGATEMTLDAPLILLGKGAIKLFEKPPNAFGIKNNHADPATVELLVCRDPKA